MLARFSCLSQRFGLLAFSSFERQICIWLCVCMVAIGLLIASPARATIDDNRYEGNIFALYGSNGGIVPPRTTLAESLARHTPTLLVFYLDDSKDCKSYSAVVANLQIRYGLGVNVIPLTVDALDLTDPNSPGRYFKGSVPQTLLFDPDGHVTYDSVGDRPITEVENAIRAIFNLQPVAEGELRRQPFNELQVGFDRRVPKS
jgi:hypothetical protein